MKNINFTDWQDLWLKKDIEGISKKISRSYKFNLSILIEIIIGIITLALSIISIINNDKGFIDKEKIICILIILVCASFIIPILIHLIDFLIKNKKISNKIKNKKMEVKDYIDKFDNEICNRIMMANTLCENISVESKIEAQQYYIGEISYYINKCIDSFKNMESMSKEIFVENNNEKVTPQRLLLLLKLIIEIRKEIDMKIYVLKEHMDKGSNGEKINNYIKKTNDKHNEYLKTFITYIHENVSKDLGFESLIDIIELMNNKSEERPQ